MTPNTHMIDQYRQTIGEIDRLDAEIGKVETRLEELSDARYDRMRRLRGITFAMQASGIPIPQEKPAAVLPKAGEVISDPMTHRAICVLARSIPNGETIDPFKDCRDWQLSYQPAPGDAIPGFREITLGSAVFYQAHVAGRWWPSMGEEA